MITINGVCDSGASGPDCKTVVTKAEFERLIKQGNANANVTPVQRRSIVQGFAQVVVLDKSAEKQGLPNDPEVKTMLEVARMRTLAQVLQQRLVQKAQQVSPEQIDEYYKKNHDEFEEVKLSRIYIPKVAASVNIDAAKAKAIAERLQKDAEAGKNLDELQKQAYTELGIQQQPLPTEMGVRRRNSFPAEQAEAIFSLADGKVSRVIEDPNGFYIYKVESKTTVPESNVSNEIKGDITQKSYAQSLDQIFEPVKAEVNPQYFDGMTTIDFKTGMGGGEEERERRRGSTAGQATPQQRPLPPRGQKPPQ